MGEGKPISCKLGPRHKWKFAGNFRQTVFGMNTASFTTRGRYVCACGATKSGSPQYPSTTGNSETSGDD